MDLCAESKDTPQFQVGLSPSFLADEESTSICPLLTPSPSEAKLICTSPDLTDFQSSGKLICESPDYPAGGLTPGPDPESVSMCPLLESSPSPRAFRHPLDSLDGMRYEEQPPVLPGYIGLEELRDSRSSSLPGSEDLTRVKRGSGVNTLLESSSSSSSALQDNPSCVQLLNHHYQQLNQQKNNLAAFMTQDNGMTPCVDLGGHKIPSNDCFVHWNWPIIRTISFWTVLSLTVACLCIVVGMVASVPKKCLPQHQWHQGSVFYEIFPASFQDSGHDGIGDLRGVAARTEYLRKLGISAVRLNSIFPSNNYPEDFQNITNLTSIDHRLGNINDLKYLITVLHSSNISLILDLPVFPLVRSLGELKIPPGRTDGPIRKDNIADKITNTVHNHRSHREAKNESDTEGSPASRLIDVRATLHERPLMLTPYIDGGISGLMKVTSEHIKAISRTVVEEALQFWFEVGVDGFYIKGLENYINDSNFLSELENWDRIKKSFSTEKARILMANYSVLENCQDSHEKMHVLETFDLLDVYLEVSNGSDFMAEEVKRFLLGDSFKDRSFSWIHWNVGSIDTKRLAGRAGGNFGVILFQSLLPGTISLFYGDEISLTDIHDPHWDHDYLRHQHQLAPMRWVNDPTSFTPSSITPWLPYGSSDTDPLTAAHVIHNITDLRYNVPPIYMNSYLKDGKVVLNSHIRYIDESMVVLERTYPRRNAYIALYNADVKDIERDISKNYFGGEVIDGNSGNTGSYVNFKKFSISAGTTMIVKLDK